jgi:ankyrin repeat protein
MDLRKRFELILIGLAVCSPLVLIGSRLHTKVLELQLSEAIARDDAATVVALLDRGISPHKSGQRSDSVTTMACSAGSKNTLAALLRHGVHPQPTDIGIPAQRNDAEMVDILLNAGSNPNVMMYERFPLIICVAENRQTDMIKKLLHAGADPNVSYITSAYRPRGFTTLMTSAAVKDVNSMRALLDAGASVNARISDSVSGMDGYTALMVAEKFNALQAAELLLKYGARTDTIANDGMSPMSLALRNARMFKLVAGGRKAN